MPDEHNDRTTEEYQNALSETVDDGSGCAEMWSALSDLRQENGNQPGIARRTFLKLGSASAVAALFPGASAASTDTDDDVEVEIQWLEGAKAKKAAAKARATKEYQQLAKRARDRGDKIHATPDNTTVARVTDGTNIREMVAFDVESDHADVANITIGRNSKSRTVPVAALEYAEQDEDGHRKKVTVFEPTDGGTKKQVVNVEQEVDRALNGEGVTTQSNTTCTGCKAAVGLICQIGCSAPLAFICGLLGITVIGGIGCLTFVAIVCGLIAIYGCSGPAEDICSDPQIGLCP